MLLAMLLCFGIAAQAQVSGGPDTYGYVWKNNNNTDPDAPVYNWIDITTTGTNVNTLGVGTLGDDNWVGPIGIGFLFRYYWSDFSQVWIGSNGYIGFQPLNISSLAGLGFPATPTVDANNNFVAPFMTDLSLATPNPTFPNPGNVYIWDNGVDSCIITYDNVPFWNSAPAAQWGGSNTFQVIFAGADSSITFQYQAQSGSWDPIYNPWTNPGVVGIENVTGNIGLMVSNNVLPTPSTAVKFYYPDTVTFSITDVGPGWVKNSVNGGFFVAEDGSPVTSNALIQNYGNTNVTTSTTALLEIINSSGTQVYNETDFVASIPVGAGSFASFSGGYNPTTAGTYRYQVTTTNTADINPTNNVQEVEMVVVDTSNLLTDLSYYGGSTPAIGNQISWAGGDSAYGIGIYIEPPFYPAEITQVEAYLAVGVLSGPNAFSIRVFDDDAGPGMGTLLGSGSLASFQATNNAWNTITFSTPIEITSGGVYIGWYQDGGGIALIQEGIGPFSQRAFEILANTWSSYRNNSDQEVLIRTQIKKNCAIAVDLGADTSICDMSNVTLDAGLSGGTYTWSSGATSQTITVSTAGTYYVDLVDASGCTGTDTIIVSINPNPTVDLGADQSDCQGASFTIDAGPGYSSYLWNTLDTASSITVISTGVYTVTVTDSNGCTAMDDVSITVFPPPNVNLGPDKEGCLGDGDNVILSANLAGDVLWSTGDTTPSITVTTPGVYWLELTDMNGCVNSDTIEVFDASFSISLGPDTLACEGATLIYDAGPGFAGYLWSTGSTDQSIDITTAGTYHVTVLNIVGCSASDTIVVDLEPLPDPDFTGAETGGGNGFEWGFTNSSTNALSYSWDFGDGVGSSTDENPTYTYVFSGTYTVILIATNDCGSDTFSLNIEVIDRTGIEEDLLSGISIYPNPSEGLFQIHFDGLQLGETRLSMYNLKGQAIHEESLTYVYSGYQHEMAIKGLTKGVYFLQIVTEGHSIMKKVLIQ